MQADIEDIECIDDAERRYSYHAYNKKLYFNAIRKMDVSNGKGIGVALFTQGCPFRCFNCFNSETWEYLGGTEFKEEHQRLILELLKSPHVSRFSILGGEPLIYRNRQTLYNLVRSVKNTYPNKKIWLYTGRKFENAIENFSNIIENVDILIDGQFVDALKDPKLKWRGSSNQRIIDVQKTLKDKNIVEIDND